MIRTSRRRGGPKADPVVETAIVGRCQRTGSRGPPVRALVVEWADRNALAVCDVCGADRRVDADPARVVAHRGFRLRVVAAGGVGAVARVAVDHGDASVLDAGGVDLVCQLVDRDLVGAETGGGGGWGLAAAGVV